MINNTFRYGESGLKNASIAGIVSTPRLGAFNKRASQHERTQPDHEESGQAKFKKYTAHKTPDKSKTGKTISAKNSREN